jgi:hypothetical protein
MLTHGEELGLSPKRTSSIMLTLLWVKEGAIRQELLPFLLLLKTHIVRLLFIFYTKIIPKTYLIMDRCPVFIYFMLPVHHL